MIPFIVSLSSIQDSRDPLSFGVALRVSNVANGNPTVALANLKLIAMPVFDVDDTSQDGGNLVTVPAKQIAGRKIVK